MLIEFERAGDAGNIAINPDNVATVFGSASDENVTIIKFADGRGMKVRGSYTQVMGRLSGNTAVEHAPTSPIEDHFDHDDGDADDDRGEDQ